MNTLICANVLMHLLVIHRWFSDLSYLNAGKCDRAHVLVFFSLCWFIAGITLGLFGGVRKHSMDQNKVPVRGDIHIIIVGLYSFCPSHLQVFVVPTVTYNIEDLYI